MAHASGLCREMYESTTWGGQISIFFNRWRVFECLVRLCDYIQHTHASRLWEQGLMFDCLVRMCDHIQHTHASRLWEHIQHTHASRLWE